MGEVAETETGPAAVVELGGWIFGFEPRPEIFPSSKQLIEHN